MTSEQFKTAYNLQKEKAEIEKHLKDFEDYITNGKTQNNTLIEPSIYNSWKGHHIILNKKFLLIDFEQFCELYKTKAEKRLEIETEFNNIKSTNNE